MIKTGHENTVIEPIGDEDIDIPSMPDAKERGYKEIASIWRKLNEDGSEQIVVQLRATYEHPSEWGGMLIMAARTIANMHSQGALTPEEIDRFGHALIAEAVQKYGEVTKLKDLPNYDLGGTSDDYADESSHPGQLDIPEDMLENPEAREILAVWIHPAVENCEGCGEDHAMESAIRGATLGISGRDIGVLLAEIARTHSDKSCDTLKEQLLMRGEVEKAFYETMNEDVAKT